LAAGAYIQDKLNIIIMGASGAGKTYLACAFGIAACRNFYPVKYVRLPELLNELAVARGEGIYKRVMKTYKKIPLLILDEWLLVSLKESEARDLLEIVEARHQIGSTIFCSQFAPAGWHGKIGESTLADAILDRIVHSSYTITIEGMDSMRKRKGLIN
jgi:DNA replication protein DnaC